MIDWKLWTDSSSLLPYAVVEAHAWRNWDALYPSVESHDSMDPFVASAVAQDMGVCHSCIRGIICWMDG